MDELEINQVLYNNLPVADFCGLSSNEVQKLVNDPLGKDSIIDFKKELSSSTLDEIPYFILTEKLLDIIEREGSLKLTKTGSLPVKVVKELYGLKIYPEYEIEQGLYKLSRESDSLVINAVHITSRLGGLIKKEREKLSLTKKGEKLRKNRAELFKNVFGTFFNKFNIGYQDNYTEYAVGQMAWAYSLYLIHKFGKRKYTSRQYCNLYLKAFPNILLLFEGKSYGSPRSRFYQCYSLRFFEKSMSWFGFIKTFDLKEKNLKDPVVNPTGLISKIFNFDVN